MPEPLNLSGVDPGSPELSAVGIERCRRQSTTSRAMPSDWAAPIDSIPSGTAHLAERYPPLPGDAAPPASFYDDAERWRSVAAEYRERGFVVVSVQPLPLRLPP